jgi:Holliday junction resolvase RusA-like endonuclease
MLRIRLPFPDSKLNPNRSHGKSWRSTREARREAHEAGYYAVHVASPLNGWSLDPDKPLRLRIGVHPPDNRRRDLDNIVSAIKQFQDGVFNYLGRDDSHITRKEVVMRRSCPEGKVTYILYQN